MISSLAAETLSFRENFPNDHLHPNAIGRYNHDPFCLFSCSFFVVPEDGGVKASIFTSILTTLSHEKSQATQ